MLEIEAEPETNTPTGYPTYMPTEAWPPCPPGFDAAATYDAGDLAEVGGHAFECTAAEDGAYVMYCNIADWDDSLLEDNENAKEMWENAWVHVSPCTEGDERQ